MAILAGVPRSNHVAKLLRLPPDLEQQVADLARREYRTFTAQVVLMLTQWLAEHGGKKP